jgi:hypothetical protein
MTEEKGQLRGTPMNDDPDRELFFEVRTAWQELEQVKRAQARFNQHLTEIRSRLNSASPEKVIELQQEFPEVFEWIEKQQA